jgi:hypothetical protein
MCYDSSVYIFGDEFGKLDCKMKEKIIEILKGNTPDFPNLNKDSAQKITTHIFEFITWKDYGNSVSTGRDIFTNEIVYHIPDESQISELCFTLEELYQYWLKEVKK